MSGIGILSPVAVAAISATANASDAPLLLTPSPREVWTGPGSATFHLDLGTVSAVDALYINGAFLPEAATISWSASATLGGANIAGSTMTTAARLATATADRHQHLVIREAPLNTRFINVSVTLPGPSDWELGILVVGKLFTHPYAYGAGRQLIDTSKRTDLIDGAFGFEAGVAKAGFRWRFVDLDDATREEIWACGYSRGIRHPVVVAEDVEAVTHASVHYGVFDRFEAWERANAADTTWALSMTEWR